MGQAALALVLFLASLVPGAEARDFVLHWKPATTTGISQYQMYYREDGKPFGAPVSAGLPALAQDGTMTATLPGLPVGPRYWFAVSAVATGGEVSARSNEISTCTVDTQCGDSTGCTAGRCIAGTCTTTAMTDGTPCSDGNVCNGNETCQHGVCARGPSLTCDDKNTCTQDSCNPTSGCVFTPSDECHACLTVAQCDDGNPCTTDSCTARGTCINVLTNACSLCTSDVQCNDNNPCTADQCIAGRCRSSQRPPGAPCGDGNLCNGEETCQAGRCKPNGFPCDDGDACTADLCDPEAGCSHVTNATCESCESVPRGEFDVNWIAFVAPPGGERLSASGILLPAVEIDPQLTGVQSQITDAAGRVLYRVAVPAGSFKVSRSGRTFRLNKRLKSLRDQGLRRLDMRITADDSVRVMMRAKKKEFGAEFPKAYTWTMLFGTQCGVNDCFLYPKRSKCR